MPHYWHRSKLLAQDGELLYTVFTSELWPSVHQEAPFRDCVGVHVHFATIQLYAACPFSAVCCRAAEWAYNLPRNAAASTTPKPRAEYCISRYSLRNPIQSTHTLLITAFGGSSLVRSSKSAILTDFILHARLLQLNHKNSTVSITEKSSIIHLHHHEVQIRCACGICCYWCVGTSRSSLHTSSNILSTHQLSTCRSC